MNIIPKILIIKLTELKAHLNNISIKTYLI